MTDPALAALLLAVDPAGLGGAVLRAAPGPARDRWLALLRAALPQDAPWRRLPLGIPDSRLLGGLDLAATLAAGRPVAERGVLAGADGGIVVAAMAERLETGTAAKLCAVLDSGVVAVQRDGLSLSLPARFALVALDEGIAEEAPPAALAERLAFRLDLDEAPLDPAPDCAAARARLPDVTVPETLLPALCGAALAFGIASLRAPLMALRAARAAAALAGREAVSEEDATLAVRLVYGHRATQLPAEQQPESEPAPEPETPAEDQPQQQPDAQAMQEMLLEATRAALPAGLLAALGAGAREAARKAGGVQGRAGQLRLSAQRGRPIGTRSGALRGGARLSLVETLRAAAPWQALRRRESAGPLIRVRAEDIRILRFRQNTETTAIFAVDASGSAALARLAEAKGAVEMLLADCYVRRDRVAVVAFRGRAAETLLPPTNSLVRAKRSLAGLPGGGATPLAAGIDAAMALAEEAQRRGRTPLLVLLTDGRANIARDGTAGRPRAEADALAAAAPVRAARLAVLLVDTAPRPQPFARQLAEAMGARYLALPSVDSQRLSAAVATTRDAA
ncbi:magnesium chelatase subunit D [Falsiroseomonas sp. E2-1-a20]|uniref:magnesium chelatase subunit D n=1 Tax=Falsiroseomonas sp. E2-1-a20 TaxID=3239300 RepID=UPI003F385371